MGQDEATHLATVQQLDLIYADFTQSVTELQQLRRDFASGALEQVAPDTAKVRLELDDGTIYRIRASCCSRTRASIRAPGR